MSVNLTKGQVVNLSKESKKGLTKLKLGLGWSSVKKDAGFFGKLVSLLGDGGESNIDLDASCLALDSNGSVVDKIWFRNLSSSDGSVRHSGDNRTGRGSGDDETITVDLTKLSPRITTMVFAINSFTGQKFDEIAEAYCRVVDQDASELVRYTLDGKDGKDATALIMMKVCRKEGGEWKVTAIGHTSKAGRTINDLLPAIRQFI